jgi:hypothetical protein
MMLKEGLILVHGQVFVMVQAHQKLLLIYAVMIYLNHRHVFVLADQKENDRVI